MLIVTIAMFSGLRIQTSRDKTKDGLRAPDNKGKEGTENKFEVRTPCMSCGVETKCEYREEIHAIAAGYDKILKTGKKCGRCTAAGSS